MYRRPKFLEVLIAIREEMAAEADYDVELLAQRARMAADEIRGSNDPIPNSERDPMPPGTDNNYTEFLENLQ